MCVYVCVTMCIRVHVTNDALGVIIHFFQYLTTQLQKRKYMNFIKKKTTKEIKSMKNNTVVKRLLVYMYISVCVNLTVVFMCAKLKKKNFIYGWNEFCASTHIFVIFSTFFSLLLS